MKSDGSQLRSYCYCLDCATAMLKVLLRGKNQEAYNISNPDSIITIMQMAEMLAAPRVPAIAKVRIMEIILERTYGKPETAIRLNGEAQSAEAARARLEAIAARIRIEVD